MLFPASERRSAMTGRNSGGPRRCPSPLAIEISNFPIRNRVGTFSVEMRVILREQNIRGGVKFFVELRKRTELRIAARSSASIHPRTNAFNFGDRRFFRRQLRSHTERLVVESLICADTSKALTENFRLSYFSLTLRLR